MSARARRSSRAQLSPSMLWPMPERAHVAVVIPTHNRWPLVLQAVESVLAQTHRDIECVVVDNGSTDGTATKLATLDDPRLRVLVHEEPLGGPASRNLGITAIKRARWVAFLDSDDLWAPTKLERQLAAMESHPDAAWSATACVQLHEDMTVRNALRLSTEPPTKDGIIYFSPDGLRALLRDENMIPAANSTVVASRELLGDSDWFDTTLSTCDDWDLSLRLASRSALAYVDLPLAAYRIWKGQQSASTTSAFIRDATTVRSHNFPGAERLPRGYRARWEQEAARRDLRAGRRLPAARRYVRSARTGLAPGQLAYAIAALAMPHTTERRLCHLDRQRLLPEGWGSQVGAWLARFRPPSGPPAGVA